MTTDIGNNSAAQLRSVVERIERLEDEKAALASDIKDIFAEIHGIPVEELRKRLWRGWTLERALTQPLRRLPLGQAALERAGAKR